MEISGLGKSPNSLSFRYNANNEVLEELSFPVCEDDPPTPQCDPPPPQSESASPKRGEKSSSIIDKYFKSIRTEKPIEKPEDVKPVEVKPPEEQKPSSVTKEVTSSPMKDYLNRLGKRSTSESSPDVKEGSNETWKIFHDFKFKIAQAVEDMKTRSVEETKEKSLPRENSTSDSEENSVMKDSDQQSVGDTDNQVSSLDSSMQNLSEMTQPLTAKATERESSLPVDNKNHSDSSEDTHKNLIYDASADMARELLNDNSIMEVESGIEALEDTIDGYGDIHNIDTPYQRTNPMDSEPVDPPPTLNNFGFPPSRNNLKETKKDDNPKCYFFNFSMYILTFLVCVNYLLFPNSNIWNGFLLGLWFFCFTSNLKCYVLDTFFTDSDQKPSAFQMKRHCTLPPTYTIPVVKEYSPLKKYEGWINHYRYPDYDPFSYHINKTATAFMKLEGCNLRISYTTTKIAKRALWDEKIEKVAFYQHRLYNLTGARVILLPKGLVKRRQWSKKYPICIVLNEKEKIQVLEKEFLSPSEKKVAEAPSEKKSAKEQHEMETETNVSPEKKKKFVWRRREKSIAHSDTEPGKEGLRHRLVRKMHRDKKSECVTTATGTEPAETQSQGQVQTDLLYLDENYHETELASKSVTSTKDETEEEIDDNELTKIKDFLEETEREAGPDSPEEGEWSVHVRTSTDKHSHIYLFARTGRDKHEWYRRLVIAVSEANIASAETSTAEDKSSSMPAPAENKEGIEMAVYKLAEKETVAFAKSPNKSDSLSDGAGVSITPIPRSILEPDNYEKTFWPYLLKIIQNKGPSTECQCRMLPAEVTWVNTLVARVMYDLMRDPVMINRLQNRIQRKLNTLKLPSFMSPLVVTELSLAGACPLVERVAAPACDARGVWLDADLRYDGGAYIALLTQINLMKLKEKNVTLEEQILSSAKRLDEPMNEMRSSKPAIFDSDMEDSAESSSDDESPPVQPVDSYENVALADLSSGSTNSSQLDQGGSSKKKFLRMVDKIATNKYFQQVTDYKYVKRAMEGLSNTDIKLHLEVHGLEGRIALNLPPPPHDRLWIGFRTNPQLVLKARPAVGARTLRFAHISNWIEQKLSKEFEKILVLPNMEDFIIDVLTPTPVKFE